MSHIDLQTAPTHGALMDGQMTQNSPEMLYHRAAVTLNRGRKRLVLGLVGRLAIERLMQAIRRNDAAGQIGAPQVGALQNGRRQIGFD